MKRICSIYRSKKKDGMYLYVLKSDALERVPEPLMDAFGRRDSTRSVRGRQPAGSYFTSYSSLGNPYMS